MRLANSAVDCAEEDLKRATEIVGSGATGELERLRARLARQREQLEQAFDADGRRSITEEARRLRQDVDILVQGPEHRAAALIRELAELKSTFNYSAHEIAALQQVKRFDDLARSAAQQIARGQPGFDAAEQQLEEMRAITARVFWSDPSFVAAIFKTAVENSHLAIDATLYEAQIRAGEDALVSGDFDGLRHVLFEMRSNCISLGAGGKNATVLATIMRA